MVSLAEACDVKNIQEGAMTKKKLNIQLYYANSVAYIRLLQY